MGTPPEDDAGAGEGAPATATDPANSERVNALSSRIDALVTSSEDDDQNGEGGEPKLLGNEPQPRLASEPSIDVPIDSEGDAPQKRLIRLKSEPVDLDEDEPAPVAAAVILVS